MIDSLHEDISPMVSVVIPSYNGEKFIKEAIDSVLNQSFQDFEIVISDDASTDKTKEIVQGYKKNSKISFFQNNERLGIGGNWNHGIKQSKGKYIKILCQDDILRPHYIERVVKILENDLSVSLVTTYEQFFGESDRVRNENAIPFINRTDGTKAQNSVLKNGNWIGGPTAVMFRRSGLSAGMFDTSLECSLDYEMWLRLLGRGDLHVIPIILFQSRIHKNQATSGCLHSLGFDKDKIRILKKMKQSPKMYGEIHTNVVQEVMKRSIQIFVDKSLNTNTESISSAWQFLNQHIGFSRSVTSLIKGRILQSKKSVGPLRN